MKILKPDEDSTRGRRSAQLHENRPDYDGDGPHSRDVLAVPGSYRPALRRTHEQPVLRSRGLFVNERYPVAERLSRQGLYLPSGLALTEQQLAQVCDAVRKAAS